MYLVCIQYTTFIHLYVQYISVVILHGETKMVTPIKIAKKYAPMIECAYRDCDGIYWIYTRRGYCIGYDEEHCRRFETRKELDRHIRMVRLCKCDDCVTGSGW